VGDIDGARVISTGPTGPDPDLETDGEVRCDCEDLHRLAPDPVMGTSTTGLTVDIGRRPELVAAWLTSQDQHPNNLTVTPR
jgi:hypothetical protein